MWLLWSCHITFRCSIMTFVVSSGFPEKGTSSRFLTHNFSCRRVNVFFLWCYVLTHKFSFHCEKDCLRSPDCEKTGQLATRKRYASERACFRPSTAQIPVKIYRSNAKSYSTNDSSLDGMRATRAPRRPCQRLPRQQKTFDNKVSDLGSRETRQPGFIIRKKTCALLRIVPSAILPLL